MKVLHFYKTYYPESYGGVQQVIYQLAEGGVRHGIESGVLYLSRSKLHRNDELGQHRVFSVPLDFEIASTGFSFGVVSRFKQLAAQADLIHFHFPWPFMDLVYFLSGVKKPTVVSYHSDIVKQKYLLQLYRPLKRLFLRRVDAIVAASPAYLQHSRVLQKHEARTRVIPYGLDESTYPAVDAGLQKQWQKKLPPKFFLFVGALRYYKGLRFLVDAAAQNGLPVVIVGASGVEEDLHRQAGELGAENIVFTGALSDADKVALLSLCMVFVFPSHLPSEAFGISMLEAAMYGKPIISCEIGTGTTFINIANETGLVVPPACSQALAAAMMKLWHDDALCQRMGQQARKRFENHFTAEKMVDSYVQLYRELLGKR